jgi:AcrR family transcriptional regulator
MSTLQDRRIREKLEMRTLIVDAAIKIYLEEGYDKLSLRGIAQAISYAPGTIYLYFKDKQELFYAMHQRAFKELMVAFEDLSTIENPLDKLHQIGFVFLDFGLKNPKLYELMFILNEPMCAEASLEDWACGLEAFQYFHNTVVACLDRNLLVGADPETVSFTLYSMLHGMISLKLRNRMRSYEVRGVDTDLLMRQTIDSALMMHVKAHRGSAYAGDKD